MYIELVGSERGRKGRGGGERAGGEKGDITGVVRQSTRKSTRECTSWYKINTYAKTLQASTEDVPLAVVST